VLTSHECIVSVLTSHECVVSVLTSDECRERAHES